MKYVELKIRIPKDGGKDGETVDILSAFNLDSVLYIWPKGEHTLIRLVNGLNIEALKPYEKVLAKLNKEAGRKS